MEQNDAAVNVLKTAILLERRGKAFYTHAARMSEDSSVKKIFEMMAEEENAHHHLLYKLNEDLKERIWDDNSFWPF